MAKYKESKRDFAHAVNQLTPGELKDEAVKELVESETEEVGEILIEEQMETVDFLEEGVSENHDMSEIYIDNNISDDVELNDDSNVSIEEEGVDNKESDTNSEVSGSTEVSEVRNMEALEQEIRSSDELRGIGDDTTYITKGTTINGNVESDGDIEILGRVDGNVRCGGKLIVGGRVTGDIETGELYAEVANISGEIRAAGTVKIGSGSVTVGNIFAETAVIAGAVKGDVDIRDSVVIDSTAVIVGNIKSKSVQVNSGAIIDGFCKQEYSDVDVEKFFNSGIESLS